MKVTKLIFDITGGVCGTLVDYLIWYTALAGASVGKISSRGAYEAGAEADEILSQINHKTLIATWRVLTKKRLVDGKRRGNIYSREITKFGLEKLSETIPQYHQIRPWDKKIYLINYDIPINGNYKRNKLLWFLKKIGAAALQDSTFVTPFNPRDLVNDFVQKYHIPGMIVISDLGMDGGIGEITPQNLMVRLYGLEDLNDRYELFIKNAKSENNPNKNFLFKYLSILKDDPQLPFDLLPKGWKGDEAYLVYQKILTKLQTL